MATEIFKRRMAVVILWPESDDTAFFLSTAECTSELDYILQLGTTISGSSMKTLACIRKLMVYTMFLSCARNRIVPNWKIQSNYFVEIT